jgi:hypothetical protein
VAFADLKHASSVLFSEYRKNLCASARFGRIVLSLLLHIVQAPVKTVRQQIAFAFSTPRDF